jgi:predicted Rossmann fold nucleotide-binding protein DprA/Smf involved in DNA uptake
MYIRGEYLPDDLFAVAISGLARGVDAIAHQSSLKSGGRTIGILVLASIKFIRLNI